MRAALSSLILIPLILAVSGCGSSQTIWVQGTVTKSGEKYKVPEGQNLGITFYALEAMTVGDRKIAAGEPFAATYNRQDSTFTVPGPEGSGIPPGKYKISFTQKLNREALTEKNARLKKGQMLFDRDTDLLKGQFGENSPIMREIKDASELTIDLDKPTP
jgi:hypothetical protein